MKVRAFTLIPTIIIAFFCMVAATDNSPSPIFANALLTVAPVVTSDESVNEYTKQESFIEASLPKTVTEQIEASDADDSFPVTGEHAVRELTITNGSSETDASKVAFSNRTNYSIDINDYINKEPDFDIEANGEPQVLIVHTHATESYLPKVVSGVDGSVAARSTDTDKNMVAVGERLAEILNANGIVTIQDRTLNDHPSYSGAYDREAAIIEEYLTEYPSIKAVFDIHRDAMWQDDGTRLKPTVLVNGKKAAQIMIISGTDKGGLKMDGWQSNLKFAAALQIAADEAYSGLMRPLNIAAARYNMHMTSGSLLFEVGSDVNTLDEALYSIELFADVITEVLT